MSNMRPTNWSEVTTWLIQDPSQLDMVWVFDAYPNHPFDVEKKENVPFQELVRADSNIFDALTEQAAKACRFDMLKTTLEWAEKYSEQQSNAPWAHVHFVEHALLSEQSLPSRQHFAEQVIGLSCQLNVERAWGLERLPQHILLTSSERTEKWDVLNSWLNNKPNPIEELRLLLEEWADHGVIPSVTVRGLEEWVKDPFVWGLIRHGLKDNLFDQESQRELLTLSFVRAEFSKEEILGELSTNESLRKPKVM